MQPPPTHSPPLPPHASLPPPARRKRRPADAQLGTRGPADRIEEIVAPDLHQAGRSQRLDYRRSRQSTRLDSSHTLISYATSCLKNTNGPRVSGIWCEIRPP